MKLAAFEQANLKSKQVRFFFTVLLFLLVSYTLGIVLYGTQEVADADMVEQMVSRSGELFAIAAMLVLFLLGLRWHILRTLILALSLLSLAHLYCALIVLIFDTRLAHTIVLLALCLLFLFLFLTQSNLLIYLRDRTSADALLEGTLAIAFIGEIIRMLSKALGFIT